MTGITTAHLAIAVDGVLIATVEDDFTMRLWVSSDHLKRVYTAAFELALRGRNTRVIADVLDAIMREEKRVAAAKRIAPLHGVVPDAPAPDAGERDESEADG